MLALIRPAWSSSTRPGPRPTWLRCAAARSAPAGQGAAWPMDDHDLPRALRHDRVEVPWLLEGPINGDSFRLDVDQVLIPTLQPGNIVIMDNLGSHRSSAVRRAPGRSAPALLPAQVLARSEPDRDALLKAQTRPAQGGTAHSRRQIPRSPSSYCLRSGPASVPTTSPKQDTLELRVIPLCVVRSSGQLRQRAPQAVAANARPGAPHRLAQFREQGRGSTGRHRGRLQRRPAGGRRCGQRRVAPSPPAPSPIPERLRFPAGHYSSAT